jgi:hypothetical protein
MVVTVVGAATATIKASGPVMLRGGLPAPLAGLVDLLAPALLAALVATQTFSASSALQVDERAAGVAAAGITIALRAPLLVTVITAAVVTGALRAL